MSFEVGIAPLTGDGAMPLFIYSTVYFALVIGISLYPGRLLDTVGHVLAPLKIVALAVLGIAALLWPAGAPIPATAAYQSVPFSSGFVNGYLTMDTLGALVFGIVIVNAALARRERRRSVDPLHHSGRFDCRRGPDAGLPEPVQAGLRQRRVGA